MSESEKDYYDPPPPRKQFAAFVRAMALIVGTILLVESWWSGSDTLAGFRSGGEVALAMAPIRNAIETVGQALAGAILIAGAAISYTLAEK